jgi:hypothetical protein
MPRLYLILLPSVMTLALPGWAEARQANAKTEQARPLNLSLPRDVLQAPGNPRIDETVERNLVDPVPSQPGSVAPTRPATLPYGAGYEHRHQERHGAGGGSGAAGNAGGGRRGR